MFAYTFDISNEHVHTLQSACRTCNIGVPIHRLQQSVPLHRLLCAITVILTILWVLNILTIVLFGVVMINCFFSEPYKGNGRLLCRKDEALYRFQDGTANHRRSRLYRFYQNSVSKLMLCFNCLLKYIFTEYLLSSLCVLVFRK